DRVVQRISHIARIYALQIRNVGGIKATVASP
ncbi:hypothetical protein pipiens_020000, partial [Culex pipiens pipiens]